MQTTQVSVLCMPHALGRWGLVNSFMQLRRDVFVERKGWDLSSYEGVEFEQYDQLGYATYVVAHDGEEVLAGCRLIRCDSQIGQPDSGTGYTYMIDDAAHGRINLPINVCDEMPPRDEYHWELTRLCARRGYPDAAKLVMHGAYYYLASQHAVGCLCLGSPAIMRVARVSGYETEKLGPIVRMDDEDAFLAFRIKIHKQDHLGHFQ